MRVFDESFEFLEFVVYAVYVNLQNDEISLVITARFMNACGVCSVCSPNCPSRVRIWKTLSMCCFCVGSAVAVGVAIVVFNVTWVFVADGELTGTGDSAAFDVRVVIEVCGVVLGEGVLCEMCICLAGGGVGGVGGE